MKKLFLLVFSFLMFGCSGYLYTDKPALELQDVDYSFSVKKALNNPEIAYIDQGKGSETLILIHGLGSNAGFWRYNIGALSQKYRVIAIDLPGYGKSQKDFYPYSLTFYADQIKRFIDELKLGKVTLVGHSMGGQISIVFALKYPQYLNKLVLAAPAGFEEFQKGEGDWLRSVMSVAGVKKTTEEGIRRNLASNFYSWRDELEWMVEERTRTVKAKDFDKYAYAVVRNVNAMLDEPTFDKLEGIKTPTLIIYGKYDGLIPNPYLNPGFSCDVFNYGHSKIQGSKIHQVDNAGHILMIEKPDEFNSTVLDFLEGK